MKVAVHKAFNLTRQDGVVAHYPMGEHDMPEADAKHWWTAIHAGVLPEVKAEKKDKAKP